MYHQRSSYRFHCTPFIPVYPFNPLYNPSMQTRTILKTVFSPPSTQTSYGFYYTIQSGDTIYSIAQTFNIPMNEIIEYNNITAPYIIYPGQRIFIPGVPTPIPPIGGKIYIVQPRDTLSQIAENNNTNVEMIININNIDNPNLIYPGQRLIIPASF